MVVYRQETAYAQTGPTTVDTDTPGNVVGDDGGITTGVTVTVGVTGGGDSPSINSGNGNVYGIKSTTSDAQNASVTINSGKMNDVQGGYSKYNNATGNTVTIYGGNITSAIVSGGSTSYGTDQTTGNTLNFGRFGHGVSGFTAQNIQHFQNLNFYLPGTIANGDSVITLSELGSTTTLGSKTASANISATLDGNTTLNAGSKVYLIKKADTSPLQVYTGGSTPQTSGLLGTAKVYSGVSVTSLANIGIEDNDLVLTATGNIVPGTHAGTTLPEQTKSIAETRAGGNAFLNGGADLLAGPGIAAAVNATRAPGDAGRAPGGSTGSSEGQPAAGGGDGDRIAQAASGSANRAHYTVYVPFAATGANSMRYHTGSYVDSHGWNATLGFARALARGNRTLTVGPLVEYGRSRYDSYLDDGIHGSGNTRYFGAGIMAREDLTNGVYYEGSLRAGRIHSDYDGLLHAGGDSTAALLSTHYAVDSTYYAMHLGLGRVQKLSRDNSLDVYAKYFFSHEGCASSQLSTGETYDFDSVNSQRLRLGTRFSHQVNPRAAFYAGLALEYEFDAESRAAYKGMSTPSPSMKGASGMLELGWRMKPSAHSPLTIDIGASGWTGKQQGVTMNAQFQWTW